MSEIGKLFEIEHYRNILKIEKKLKPKKLSETKTNCLKPSGSTSVLKIENCLKQKRSV